MVNALTTIRTEVKDALENAGLKSVEYVNENIVPPVCVVVPANPYITLGEGKNPFGQYSIGIHVLVIGGKGTNKTAATNIDSMLVDAINALEDDWDITEVTAPQEMTLKGVNYIGAVVTLETNNHIEKEVI